MVLGHRRRLARVEGVHRAHQAHVEPERGGRLGAHHLETGVAQGALDPGDAVGLDLRGAPVRRRDDDHVGLLAERVLQDMSDGVDTGVTFEHGRLGRDDQVHVHRRERRPGVHDQHLGAASFEDGDGTGQITTHHQRRARVPEALGERAARGVVKLDRGRHGRGLYHRPATTSAASPPAQSASSSPPVIAKSRLPLTRVRSSLPTLKKGRRLAGTGTG